MRGCVALVCLLLAIPHRPADAGPRAAPSSSRELFGVVLDPSARPLEGCRVTIGEVSAVSDARGRFRLLGPATLERESSLVLEAPGYAVKHVPLPNLPDRPALDLGVFELSAAIEVRGRVVDGSGGPVAGARVLLVAPGGRQESRARSDGRFRFIRVEPGRYDLAVEAEGFVLTGWRGLSVRESLTLEPLTLEPGAALAGRIEDAAGEPVAAATVRVTYDPSAPPFLFRLADDFGPRSRTGPDGRFRLAGLRAGSEVTLGVEVAGVLIHSLHQLRIPATSTSLDVGALVLPASRSVSGRVVDPAGNPIAGARLSRRPKAISVFGVRLAVETDPDGVFRMPRVQPGEYVLEVSALGFRARETVELRVAEGTGPAAPEPPLEIVLQPVPAGALGVAVRPHPGSSLPRGAKVQLQGVAGATERVNVARPLDADGRARWERLPAGRYLVSIVGERSERLHEERLELGAGATDLGITLPAPQPTAEVTGELLGPDSEPIAFTWLWFRRADHRGPSVGAFSDGRGRWHAELAPGVYRLAAEHSEYLPLEIPEVEVGAGAMSLGPLQLERGLELGGRVVGLTRAEAARLVIGASSSYRHVAGQIEPEGRFRLAPLSPGDWSIEATISGTPLRTGTTVTVPEGGSPPPVVLAFPATVRASGRVTDHGAPLAGARVSISPAMAGPGAGATATTDATGRFEVPDLAPGSYDLRVSVRPVGRIARRLVELPADSEIEIALDTGRVAGRTVRADDGQGIAGVHVRFQPLDQDKPDADGVVRITTHERFTGVQSDGDGRFAVEPLETGAWRLSAYAEGFVPASVELRIEDGVAVEDLEIELVPTPGLDVAISTELGVRAYGVRAELTDADGAVVAETTIGEHETDRAHWREAPPGRWSLTVRSQVMGTRVTVPVVIPGPVAEVVLPSVGKLHLAVEDLLDGREGAELTLWDAGGKRVEAGGPCCRVASRWPISTNRWFYVWGVEPGFYQARVEAEDGRHWSQWVAIDPDVITEITLD